MQTDEQYIKMTKTPINRLITSLCIPTIISMLITNIYNLADSFFVGKINTSASGAIGVVLAVQGIIQAFGFTFGHGAGSIISRKLGERNTQSANIFASTSFFLSLLTGIIITILGLIFINPMLKFMGSTETILPYARSYAKYILLAAPFMAGSCVLNNIMRYEGRALLAMIGLSTGGILNIIADPIFMFVFNLGIDGAGIATALSQLIGFLILLCFFLTGKTQSKLSVKNITHNIKDVKNIITTGFPSLIRQSFNSVGTMALNHSAAPYGDAAVAAMSIVGRVSMFIASLMIGIGQGLQPVAAYNFGAQKYSRVKQAFKFTLKTGEISLTILAAVCFIISANIVGIFRNDPDVIAIGVPALRMSCLSLLLQPLGVCANMTFQSTGASGRASFTALLRSGIYFLPLIVVLPRFMGITGVQAAQPIADALTFITSLPMIASYLKKLPQDR